MALNSALTGSASVEIFRRAIEEGWNRGRLEVVDELFAPDFVEHQDGIEPGREGVKGSIRSLRAAFPDLRLTLEDAVAQGDRVWARLIGTGTHEGPFMGRAGTGRTIRITVVDVCRIANGRIVEHWGVADRLSVAQQLGVLPGER